MIASDGKEWLFFVMKQPGKDGTHIHAEMDAEIVNSFTDPLEAAQIAHDLNKARHFEIHMDYFYLEARPVLAEIECESAELNPDAAT